MRKPVDQILRVQQTTGEGGQIAWCKHSSWCAGSHWPRRDSHWPRKDHGRASMSRENQTRRESYSKWSKRGRENAMKWA